MLVDEKVRLAPLLRVHCAWICTNAMSTVGPVETAAPHKAVQKFVDKAKRPPLTDVNHSTPSVLRSFLLQSLRDFMQKS